MLGACFPFPRLGGSQCQPLYPTNDGHHLALGQLNGTISIRTKAGDEKLSIKRNAPVWTLSWNPSRGLPNSTQIIPLFCDCFRATVFTAGINHQQMRFLPLLNAFLLSFGSETYPSLPEEPFDILAAGCWDQTLSFYHLSGKPIGRDRCVVGATGLPPTQQALFCDEASVVFFFQFSS